MSSTILAPFQLLELNIISAQDLAPVSRSMRAYAVAWVHPNRKLSTRVDAHGRNNPTWNDKFVFRVDEDFLHNDTSAVMIEIFALHWFRDMHVGTVRVLVGNLIPPPTRSLHHSHRSFGMRFVALQVRRPSGRPQGILNIGVALLDSSMRSMPLYTQLSSALGYRHLMGEEDIFTKNTSTVASTNQNNISTLLGKPDLRRTKSDSSSMIGSEIARKSRIRRENGNGKASSVVGGSELSGKGNNKGSSKGSSVFSGSDIFKKPNNKVANSALSAFSGSDLRKDQPGREGAGKVRSLVNGIETVNQVGSPTKGKIGNPGSMNSGSDGSDPPRKVDPSPKAISPRKPFARDQGYEFVHPNKLKLYKNVQPVITESELGPSPSEVAAAKAKEKLLKQTNDEESSVMMAWDMDSSVEGLQSKLERWRAELPPLYDSSFPSSSAGGGGGGGTTARHSRRHTDGGSGPGLFSCFSNICGCECSIVCGSSSSSKTNKKKSGSSGRLIRSPSINNDSSFF